MSLCRASLIKHHSGITLPLSLAMAVSMVQVKVVHVAGAAAPSSSWAAVPRRRGLRPVFTAPRQVPTGWRLQDAIEGARSGGSQEDAGRTEGKT